jgi:hypothetical protein
MGAYVLFGGTPGGISAIAKEPIVLRPRSCHIANLIYVPLPDENAEWLRYRAGELDLTQSVHAAAFASICEERLGGITYRSVSGHPVLRI